MATWSGIEQVVMSGEAPLQVSVMRASPEALRLVGMNITDGRLFHESDGPSAILSHEAWTTYFGRSTGTIGSSLTFARGLTATDSYASTFKVVGVARPGLRFAGLAPDVLVTQDPNVVSLGIIARLRPNVSLDEAAHQAGQVAATMPGRHEAAVRFYAEDVLRARERPLAIIAIGTVVLLLAACASAANVLLVDVARRTKERQIRTQLGATSIRLVREEARRLAPLLVPVTAVTALVAAAVTVVLDRLVPSVFVELKAVQQVDLDAALRCLALSVGAVALSAIGALLIAGVTASGHVERRLRHVFTVLAFSTAIFTVAVTAVVSDSVRQLLVQALGGDHHGVYTIVARPWALGHPASDADVQVILNRMRKPGVEDVAAGTASPLGGGGNAMTMALDTNEAIAYPIAYQTITPNYFNVLRLPLVRGRAGSTSSTGVGQTEAVVSREFERRFYNGDAIGRAVYWRGGQAAHIVGVVSDIRPSGIRDDVSPMVYFFGMSGALPEIHFVIRERPGSSVPLQDLAGEVSSTRTWVVRSATSVGDRIDQQTHQERLLAAAAKSFSVVGTVLGVAGIAGFLSIRILQRRKDTAIRLALGAGAGRIARAVVVEASVLCLQGGLIGLPLSLWAVQRLQSFVYGTMPSNLSIVMVAVGVCGGAAVAAVLYPAWKAGRISPRDWLAS